MRATKIKGIASSTENTDWSVVVNWRANKNGHLQNPCKNINYDTNKSAENKFKKPLQVIFMSLKLYRASGKFSLVNFISFI